MADEVGMGGEDSPPGEGVAVRVCKGEAAWSCPHLSRGLAVGSGHFMVAYAGGAEGGGAGGADAREEGRHLPPGQCGPGRKM